MDDLLTRMTEPTAAILVVEDDTPTRTFLADNLTADGYDLLVADTLRDALRTLEYHHVDLAVVDLGLPDGSGLELLRAVRDGRRRRPRGSIARLPLIVLSGRAGEPDRVRGFERGADDFLAKPFSYGELRLRVAALLRRARERPSEGRLRVGDARARSRRARGAAARRARDALAEGVRAAATARRPSRRGCSRRPSCCATSGASARSARRAPSTSHACRLRQQARRPTATASWSTCGASATGSSTAPSPRMRRPPRSWRWTRHA